MITTLSINRAAREAFKAGRTEDGFWRLDLIEADLLKHSEAEQIGQVMMRASEQGLRTALGPAGCRVERREPPADHTEPHDGTPAGKLAALVKAIAVVQELK